jgi:hypothetical protein
VVCPSFLFFIPNFSGATNLAQVCLNEVEELSTEGLLSEEPTHEDCSSAAFSAIEICPPTNDELSQLEELKTVPITRRNARSVSAELERIEECAPFVIENYLAVRSGDNRNFIAFKQVFDELISRRQASKWSVARWQWTGDNQRRHDPRPSLCDFAADIFLASKEVLTVRQYRILASFAANEFRNWGKVPEGIRHDIQGRVGANLIRKKISTQGSTKNYWMSTTLSQRAAA